MASEIPAVISGLTVGATVIAIFALAYNPVYRWSDQDVMEYSRTIPEIHEMRERYGQTIERINHQGTTTFVEHSMNRTWYVNPDSTPSGWDHTKELRLTVKLDPYANAEVFYECLGPISVSAIASVEIVKATECIERP